MGGGGRGGRGSLTVTNDYERLLISLAFIVWQKEETGGRGRGLFAPPGASRGADEESNQSAGS